MYIIEAHLFNVFALTTYFEDWMVEYNAKITIALKTGREIN